MLSRQNLFCNKQIIVNLALKLCNEPDFLRYSTVYAVPKLLNEAKVASFSLFQSSVYQPMNDVILLTTPMQFGRH
jgi:hypothetical protein